MTMTIIMMKMKVIAVGLRSMMSAESLELTNHRTISKPASTAGPDGKISFLFFYYYYFFIFIFFRFFSSLGLRLAVCFSFVYHIMYCVF